MGAHSLRLLFCVHLTERLSESGADDEHIALLELDPLFFGDGFNLLDRDPFPF